MSGGAVVGWLVGLVALYLLYAYNRLVRLRNAVQSAWHQVDVQLRRRHDLIPNLVEVVRGYMAHERDLLQELVRARDRAVRRNDLGDRIRAEEALGRQTTRFFAVAEGYPELKAHENTALLMEELTSTENRIAFARQFYNDCCRALNNGVESFPSVLVARTFDFGKAPYFEAGEMDDGPEPVG